MDYQHMRQALLHITCANMEHFGSRFQYSDNTLVIIFPVGVIKGHWTGKMGWSSG